MDISSNLFAYGTLSSLPWHFAWNPRTWDGPRPTWLLFLSVSGECRRLPGGEKHHLFGVRFRFTHSRSQRHL